MDDESTTVSIHTTSGELINDRTSWEISKQFTDLSIISNGLQWFSVGVSEISGITTTQLSDNAITSEKIADGSITGSDIQNSAVDTTQLADNAVTSAKIVDGTITGSDINNSAIGTTQLADNAVTSAKIIDGTITGSDIQNSAVDTTQLADNAVTSAKIIDGTITGSDIQNSAVDTTQLADNAITSDKISDATITSADLADSSILPSKLSGNPGNGNNGSILISKGDGTFDWRESGDVFDTTPGVSASLEYSIACKAPFDVEVDNSGNIYVLQSNGYIMVYTASGEFSYSIGTGEYSNTIGSFKYPFSIDVDNNGKIYVSELNGHRVQVFTADGNYSYSIGTGAANTSLEGFYSPSGIAIDNNGKIYVSDTRQNSRIMVFTASGSYDYSINAPIRWSNDLFVDNNGNIYLSDDNNCVHVFASGSYSYSFGSAGNSPGEFTTPHDVALDSNGNIYVSEKNNHRVQVFTASGDYDYSITHNDLMLPQGICVHNSKIYIVSASKNKILVFNPPSPTYHSVESAYIGIGTATPTETLEVDGNIKINKDLILSTGSSSVSQTVLKTMSQSEARTINLPDASGIVVVTDDGNVSIPDGAVTASKLAGNPGNGTAGETLISKGDGTFDWGQSDTGGAFVTNQESGGSGIRDLTISSGVDANFSAFNVAVDSNDRIYVADKKNNRIQVFTSSGAYDYSIGTGSSGSNQGQFYNPTSVALDSNDNIYVADQENHRIQVFTAQGVYNYSIGTGSSGCGQGQFFAPNDVTVDSSGKIYVADNGNNRIQVFTASGSYDYSIGKSDCTSGTNIGEFDNPYGLYVDSNGKIYVAENSNHRIQVFTASGAFDYSIGTGSLDDSPEATAFPTDVVVNNNGDIIVSEYFYKRIKVFKASGAYSYSFSTIHEKSYGSYGLSLDSNGKVISAENFFLGPFDDFYSVSRYVLSSSDIPTHTVQTGNVGIGTTSPTEKLEVDGNIKINNNLILSTGTSSDSQTVLKAMTQSEARTITLPDTSGIVVVTDDGNISIPDGSVTASKLAGNPGNGTAGETLVSKGDGTFDWGQSGLVTSQGSSAGFDYSLVSDAVSFSDEICDVEIDSSGKIYVSDSIKHCIYVFTSTGTFDYSIGNGPGSASGQFNTPYGLTVDSNDKIYVADHGNNRIQVFTASGNYEYSIVNIDDPGDVAVDKNGKIYVTQETSFQVLTASGNFEYSIGKDTKGTGQGEFDTAFGIDVDSDGKIYVADVANFRIQVFTASGEYEYSIFHWLGIENLIFGGYYDVALDNSGKIYVSDSFQGRFVVYTAEGNLDYSILVNDTLMNSGIDVDSNGKVCLVGVPWIFSTETESRVSIFNIPSDTTHTIENGNVGIGTSSPTEKLEVDGNIKINNDLILSTGSSSVSQTVLKTMSQSEARTITLPDASGIVVVTDDGNISIPDGSVTASKLAGNPGNGTAGETLVSKGDGTFTWETPESTFLTTLASAENIAYSIGSNSGSGSDPGQFNYPTNVTLDNNGSIYVTDASNRRIQVFTSSGDYSYSIVTGHGSNGLALDSKGNIYVNDEGNHRVRVFTAAGDYSYSIGTGSSGNAAGQFNNPSGIAVDSNDNIYVSDALNSRIQVFTAQGNYSYSFNAGFITSGITLDSSGNIYVSDDNNHCIQVFTAQGINTNTIGSAGSGAGQLDSPFGMDIDSNGNIYVAEMNNNRVQVFTASGAYSYSIGQLNRPFGVATDNSKIYVADKDNHRIMVYNIQQTTHTVSTGNVGIGTASPTEKLEVDGNIKINNDLILSTGSSSISQTVLKTMSQSVARTITLPDTSGIVVVTDDGTISIPDGSVTASKLAGNPGNGTVGETLVSKGDGTFDWGQSGLVTSQGSSAGFDYSLVSDAVSFSDEICDVEIDSSGKIYVSDSIKHCIYVFTSTGTFDYSIGNGPGSANGQFYTPYGLTVDSNDKIYVADHGNNRIQVFTASGDYEYSIVNIDDPGDVAVDKNGKIYVTQETSFQVLTASGNFDYSIGKDTKGTGQGEFDFAFGIDVDSDGKIYVADVGNDRIQVFTASGVYDYSIPHWFGLGFGGYYDVALDNSGKIYVSDSSQGRFVVYTAEGNLDYSILVNDTLFNTGIDVDNNGRVYLVGSPWFFSTETESRVSIFNIPSDTTHTIENGNVGIGTSSPTETLEVNGTVKINNALKLEPMTSPPTNASEGTLYYDSDDHKLKVYNGTDWKECF
jgi:DNA-binding beta-propeller fold protein YncE